MFAFDQATLKITQRFDHETNWKSNTAKKHIHIWQYYRKLWCDSV